MIPADLKKARPGMYFFVHFSYDCDVLVPLKQAAEDGRIQLDLKNLEFVTKYYSALVKDNDPPGIIIKIPAKFDAPAFLREFGEDIVAIESLVTHGAYCQISMLMLLQHAYASTDCENSEQGFMEILEIISPPPDRARAVLVQYFVKESYLYYEFDRLSRAKQAFKQIFEEGVEFEKFSPSLRRACGNPWFYAQFPEELND